MLTECWLALMKKPNNAIKRASRTRAVSKRPSDMGTLRWRKNTALCYQPIMKADTKALKLVRRPAPLDAAPGVEVAELEEYHGLTRDQMLKVHRTTYLSRRLDDKDI